MIMVNQVVADLVDDHTDQSVFCAFGIGVVLRRDHAEGIIGYSSPPKDH